MVQVYYHRQAHRFPAYHVKVDVHAGSRSIMSEREDCTPHLGMVLIVGWRWGFIHATSIRDVGFRDKQCILVAMTGSELKSEKHSPGVPKVMLSIS